MSGNKGYLLIFGLALIATLSWFLLTASDARRVHRDRGKKLDLLGALVVKATPEASSEAERRDLAQKVADFQIDGIKAFTRGLIALLVLTTIVYVVLLLFGSATDSASELRKQVITALLTALATIAGFYFGSRASDSGGTQTGTVAASSGGEPVVPPPTPGSPKDSPPTVSLDDPIVEGDSVRLRGSVKPAGAVASYRFEIGESTSYDQFTPEHQVQAIVANQNVVSDNMYKPPLHYRLVAWNSATSLIGTTEDRAWPSSSLSAHSFVQLIGIHLEGGLGHEHVASVMWLDPVAGGTSSSTVAETVNWLGRSGRAYVADQGRRVPVVVVEANPPYLRTQADDELTDNLLSLPRY